MTKIKISLKACGCTGDYDEKEITKNKFIEKDVNDLLLTEKDLRSILESLIIFIEEIKALYPDERTDVISRNNNMLNSIMFEIAFKDKSGSTHVIEEKAFFEQVVTYDGLSSLILKYCEVTDNGEDGSRIWMMDEYGEGCPAGTYAMLALVNQSKDWISNYIDFLRTNDLDHEVEQMWDIKSIIEKYGWCHETCRLAIARNISCCGQSGKEQFNDFLNHGLLEYLSSNENRIHFLDLILQEFKDWDQVEFRIKDGYKKYYLDYVVNYVQHFDKILEKKEINEIETYLLNKWDDHHNSGSV